MPFFEYPPKIRRIIYTTNAIELVNMSRRTGWLHLFHHRPISGCVIPKLQRQH